MVSFLFCWVKIFVRFFIFIVVLVERFNWELICERLKIIEFWFELLDRWEVGDNGGVMENFNLLFLVWVVKFELNVRVWFGFSDGSFDWLVFVKGFKLLLGGVGKKFWVGNKFFG